MFVEMKFNCVFFKMMILQMFLTANIIITADTNSIFTLRLDPRMSSGVSTTVIKYFLSCEVC